jgi:hypothetical protein
MAKGKSYIVIDEVTDRMRRGAMTDWAKKNNVTNGQMTRDQYLAYFKERTSGGGGGMFNMFRRGGGGGGPRGR